MGKNKPQSLNTFPALGPGDPIGSGDSSVIYNLLDTTVSSPWNAETPLADDVFARLRDEVAWNTMHHATGAVPRLVAVQGLIDPIDGSKPVYRHPSDRSPPLAAFTPAVDLVRKEAEKHVGHPLNHALVQLYRNGKDFISEHSDKTLDVVRGSSIVNASFGATRTMRLRSKRADRAEFPDDEVKPNAKEIGGGPAQKETEGTPTPRETQRIPLPHNSLFVLSQATNATFLHSIPADKRPSSELSADELAYSSERISLTFRNIGTFLSADETRIWGQGAKGKSKETAGRTINGVEEENIKVVTAMGRENREGDGFDWNWWYGDGFDVLHFVNEEALVGYEDVDGIK